MALLWEEFEPSLVMVMEMPERLDLPARVPARYFDPTDPALVSRRSRRCRATTSRRIGRAARAILDGIALRDAAACWSTHKAGRRWRRRWRRSPTASASTSTSSPAPSARGKGYGRAVMGAALNWVRSMRAPRIAAHPGARQQCAGAQPLCARSASARSIAYHLPPRAGLEPRMKHPAGRRLRAGRCRPAGADRAAARGQAAGRAVGIPRRQARGRAKRPEAALIRELEEELGISTKTACLAPLTFASPLLRKLSPSDATLRLPEVAGDAAGARACGPQMGAAAGACATIRCHRPTNR